MHILSAIVLILFAIILLIAGLARVVHDLMESPIEPPEFGPDFAKCRASQPEAADLRGTSSPTA